MTLLGALTPTARPLSCSTDTNLYGIEFATGARYGILGPIDTQACMPPGYIAEMSDYYYPASVCPYGYTVACDPIPVTVVQDNAVVTQIAYTCCPTQQAFSCMTSASRNWQSPMGCAFEPTVTGSTTITSIYLNGSTQVTTYAFTTTGTNGFGAYGIQMRAPTSTPLSSGNSAITSTATSSGLNTSASGGGNGGGGGGISNGAAAGIGIAVALVGIGAILLIFLAYRRRKDRNLILKKKPETLEKAGNHDTSSYAPVDVAHGAILEMGNIDPDQPEMSGEGVHRSHPPERRYDENHSAVAELDG